MPTQTVTPESALGELFITGFAGLELPEDTASFLTQARVGGVLLDAGNFESPAQLAELVNQIQEGRRSSPLPFWIATDHEGGKVQRFKKGFTRIPSASSIGAANSPKLAFEIAEVMARELAAVGINLNFAPVVDIFTHAKNAVIESRAFGADEETVSKMSSGTVRGQLVHGVVPCAKHFPGHGDTSTDSHHALPTVQASRETLEARELRPFQKAIKSRCPMVMTAHVLYPALDPERPATLSKRILTELLRKEMRYTRLIVTDDLGMKAITDHCAPEDAPRLALEAGCDLLLYAQEAAARKGYAALARDLEAGRLDPKLVMAAYDRIASAKHEYLKKPYRPVEVAQVGQVVGISAHQEIVAKIP